MKVVVCEPNKPSRIAEIESGLESLQQVVGGLIEAVYPFEDEDGCCLICNEEGKYNSSEPNRAIFDEKGDISDIIFGTFIICGCGEENFCGLTDEQLQKYADKFRCPEQFIWDGGRIRAIRFEAEDQ